MFETARPVAVDDAEVGRLAVGTRRQRQISGAKRPGVGPAGDVDPAGPRARVGFFRQHLERDVDERRVAQILGTIGEDPLRDFGHQVNLLRGVQG